MSDPWWIWCLFLVIGFGACLGSFTNVIIHRMPRNQGLNDPKWSYCPHCETRIRWMHNIPILSFFLLRGRCASCAGPIAPRYVIVEIMMVMVFVLIFDAMFVSGTVDGIIGHNWSVAYRFYSDWTIYAACAMLFACLLAMSAIDMEEYWVDIRFTHLAAGIGFLMHALWSPGAAWPRPGPRFGLACIAASIAAVITHLITSWMWRRQLAQAEAPADLRSEAADAAPTEASSAPPETVPEASSEVTPASSPWPGSILAVLAAGCLAYIIGGLVWQLIEASGAVPAATSITLMRFKIGLLFIFVALVAGSAVHRPSDQEIAECLDAERVDARRMALRELAILLPTVAVFVITYFAIDPLLGVWQWRPLPLMQPVAGLGRAASGFIVATALGWGVRILFTLLLGKEAFGSGDIHLMGAAGAVVGWEVVLLGFFLSSVLALLGKLLTLPLKRSRILPMGPWLTLGIFIVTLYQASALERVVQPMAEAFEMMYSAWRQ